jgi:HEAT repeat protein
VNNEDKQAQAISAAEYAGIIGNHRGDIRIRVRLEKLLENPDTRRAALHGLEKMADPASAVGLNQLVDEPDRRVAYQLVSTLAAIGGPVSVATLQTTLPFWQHDRVMRSAIESAIRDLCDRL